MTHTSSIDTLEGRRGRLQISTKQYSPSFVLINKATPQRQKRTLHPRLHTRLSLSVSTCRPVPVDIDLLLYACIKARTHDLCSSRQRRPKFLLTFRLSQGVVGGKKRLIYAKCMARMTPRSLLTLLPYIWHEFVSFTATETYTRQQRPQTLKRDEFVPNVWPKCQKRPTGWRRLIGSPKLQIIFPQKSH